MGSADIKISLWPGGPMPGQKSIRLAKKGGGPSWPYAGFCRFSHAIPLPRVSLRRERGGEKGRFDPGPFWLRRLPFCPGNNVTGLIDQLNWR